MNNQFTIYGLIIDTENDNSKDHYFIELDTKANKAIINHIINKEFDDNDADNSISKMFTKKPDYHFTFYSKTLVQIVDQLGGIYIDNKLVDGKKALEIARDERLEEVLNAILSAMSGKNTFLTLPGLLSTIKDSYTSDIPAMDIIKIVLSEVGDFDRWKTEIRTY